jgi:hypothetical protein
MRRPLSPTRLLTAALFAGAAALVPAQLASAGPPAPPVPAKIAVQDGHKLYLVTHAAGVQIYSCNAAPGGYAWSPATPRADLFADNGQPLGTHFGGPSWQARDGSLVVGRRVDGVTVDPSAIPWLLVAAASTASGPDGDRLTATTFIQRINTTGGLPPAAADCNATTVGTAREIAYTADYLFWKATGGPA